MRGHIRDLGLIFCLAFTGAAQQLPPGEALFRHAIELHQAGDLEGAIRGYRDCAGPIQLSSRRRTSVAAESCDAVASNRGRGAIHTDFENRVA